MARPAHAFVPSLARPLSCPRALARSTCARPAPRDPLGALASAFAPRPACLFPTTPRRAYSTPSTPVCSTAHPDRTVLVPIADGSEEIETVTIVDTLVRAGAKVTVASVGAGLQVRASRGVKIVADVGIEDVKGNKYDVIALPGGMPGAEHLRDSATLTAMLQAQAKSGGLIAAICASPAVVLAHHGLLNGVEATCYPHFMNMLDVPVDDDDAPVVIDGNFITSKGPGTALVFSLALVEKLYGSAKAVELAAVMLLDLSEDWTYESKRKRTDGFDRTIDVEDRVIP